MKISHILAGAAVGAGFLLAGTASPAYADPDGCSAWQTSSTFAYGVCTDRSDGGAWRLGIICADGDYKWSRWKHDTVRTSLRCDPGQGVITHRWIDTRSYD